MRRLILTKMFLVLSLAAFAQLKESDLPVLFRKYHESGNDTNRVRILLKIDSIYLYKMPDVQVIFDSAILMAWQARELSSLLHFNDGFADATFLLGNSFAEKNDIPATLSVISESQGELKIHLLIMLGEHYLFKPGDSQQDMDSAYTFLIEAKNLSNSINSSAWLYQSLCSLGKYYFTKGEIDEGKKCFMRPIGDYHRSGNLEREAYWWNQLGSYLPDNEDTYQDEISGFENALTLYRKLNLKKEEPSLLQYIGYIHQLHNHLDLASAYFLQAVNARISMNDKNLLFEYGRLTEISLSRGNYNKAVYYAQQAIKYIDTTSNRSVAGDIFYKMGQAYDALDETDSSFRCYKQALDLIVEKNIYLFPALRKVVNGLIEKEGVGKALVFLENFLKRNTPLRIFDKEIVAELWGNCFNALGKYDMAEKKYLDMISLDEEEEKHFKNEISGFESENLIKGAEACYTIGHFYTQRKRFNLAEPYLLKALQTKTFPPTLKRKSDIYLLLFEVDSAHGKYLAAMADFKMHKQLNDSIFNVAKIREIEELKISYATDKKEKDLKVLSARSQVQAKELQGSAQTRRLIVILLIVSIILIGVVFSRYRIKQKSNELLQSQQLKINFQNQELRTVTTEQQKLIAEKEWLVKEIHHRVKNNLQIVISLLNVQSSYLDSPSAINAIQESRERMQAIALIHQKLYQTDLGTSINIRSYIDEMTGFLSGFTHLQKVKFHLDVDNITMDVAQSMPLGLILNEAITNSLKYAFTGGQRGLIIITLRQLSRDDILLEIKDNGKGYPDNMDFSGKTSIGIQLMKLFAEQLEGVLQFRNNNGAQVELVFKRQLADNFPGLGEAANPLSGESSKV
ncbi:MAG: sensor histidine kinase [Ginsengibacter sp.]